MNRNRKTGNNQDGGRFPRAPAWLVSAFCVLGTGTALYFAGVFPSSPSPAEAQGPVTAAGPDQVVLAYTVNNLGYTATCG